MNTKIIAKLNQRRNSALYWGAQMFGGFLIGAVCDMPWLSRPMRAKLAWLLLFLVGNGVMGGGLAFENLREANPKNWIEFQSSTYAGPVSPAWSI